MATESPSRHAVLEPVEARQAARVRRTRRFGPRSLRGRLAGPESAGDASVVVIVGSSRDAIDRAQGRLALVLAIASPLLIAALAGGGWLLSGAALHPVERMTEEADSISAAETGRRLPQPP